MPDLLEKTRIEIADRLKELKPLVDEYGRLEAAGTALGAASTANLRAAAESVPRRRGPGRKPAAKTTSKAPTAANRKPGRRKGSGGRAAEAHALVKGQPGITIAELAAKMGINQNYLYRVLPRLAKDGKVTKRGRGWHPKSD